MLLAGTCEVLLVSGSWHSWQAHVAACVCDFQPNKSRSVHFGSALKLWMASSLALRLSDVGIGQEKFGSSPDPLRPEADTGSCSQAHGTCLIPRTPRNPKVALSRFKQILLPRASEASESRGL